MNLKLGIKILDTNSVIGQKISQALIPQINKYLDTVYGRIEKIIPDLIVDSITQEPEYSSLLSGQLKGEFGIPDPETRLSSILSTIKSGYGIVRKPTAVVNGKISAGIIFQMIRSDFQDLLSIGSASFVTEKGSQLNWLQWMLIEGDSVIISDYSFVAGSSPYSRTGLGIMKQFGGAFWRVPPEFAGDINNNWITRAIDNSSSRINKELENILKA